MEVNKGMYGLKQSGLLANELLAKRLNKNGYHQSKLVPGLWVHESRPIQFTLVVDDFGIKYEREQDARHLMKVLTHYYEVTHGKKGMLIHRNHARLGLQEETSSPIHARICQ